MGKAITVETVKKKREEFEKVVKPVIEYLNNTGNPHTKIIIETDGAETVQGTMSMRTDEFIRD